MESEKNISIKQYFQTNLIVFTGLACSPILFTGIAYYLQSEKKIVSNPELDSIFQYAVPGLCIALLALSTIIFKTLVRTIYSEYNLPTKLLKYRSFLIIKFALLETACMIPILAYLLTGIYIYLMIAGGMIVIFLISRPTKVSLINDLELSTEQLEKLDS